MAWQARFMIQNGKLIAWEDARIHPHALAVTYAATVFEGIRAYRHPKGGFSVFRLDEHLERLAQGVKIMRMDDPPSTAQLKADLLRLIPANEPDDDVYLRLQVLIDGPGTQATRGPTGWTIVAIPRERNPKRTTGLAVGVSSWTRLMDNASPPRVKATANYHAGRLATLQARADGYDAPILLNTRGKVSEAAAACLFIIRKGTLITPGLTDDILESVTRDTVITMAREAGYRVEEDPIDRTELYVADEIFLCGTGQELTPVTSVDRLAVGDGTPGRITMALQARYESLVRGTTTDHPEWRTPV